MMYPYFGSFLFSYKFIMSCYFDTNIGPVHYVHAPQTIHVSNLTAKFGIPNFTSNEANTQLI